MWNSRWVSSGLLVIICIMTVTATAFSQARETGGTFEQVWRTVNENFYDPEFNGVDWHAMRDKYGPLAAAASPDGRASVINAMLAELRTSHTHFYTPADPAYYQLLGVFLPNFEKLRERLESVRPDLGTRYCGIGLFTEAIDGKTFISGVLHGGPAENAGLLPGDEITAVNGNPFHPIRSFDGMAGKKVMISIRRKSGTEPPLSIAVVPRILDGETMFLDAMRASIAVIECKGHSIGYVRMWSYASRKFQDMLEGALLFGKLKDTEALILDLRGGWGGANPTYLNLFTDQSISMKSVDREGTAGTFKSGWNKPVVVLIDGGSRSGKELLAYGFKKFRKGKLVGTRTAGYALGASPFLMDDGGLLYLAVRDSFVDGTERLEGVGVAPDVTVELVLPYAAGADPQKERAIIEALKVLD